MVNGGLGRVGSGGLEWVKTGHFKYAKKEFGSIGLQLGRVGLPIFLT